MEMTLNEITQMYNSAKHKGRQISILAQLNSCDTDIIREILGLSPSIPKKRRIREKSTRLKCIYTIQFEEFYYSNQRETAFIYKDIEEARRAQVAMVSRRRQTGLDGVKIKKQRDTIFLRKEE